VPEAGTLRRAKRFLDYSTQGLSAYARAHDGLPYFEQHSILGERLEGAELAQRQAEPSAESARKLLPEVFKHHFQTQFLSEFMPKVDGGTMHYAVEARSPLLDQKLWEFAAALSPEVRLRGGVLKAVLREIVRRRVSPEVAGRSKQGFTVPVDRHLTSGGGDLDILRHGTELEKEGWIRRGSLKRTLTEADEQKRVSSQLWHVLVLENWLRHQGAREAISI
jgi:asparagine synthase (glutamine-hydrolysing)